MIPTDLSRYIGTILCLPDRYRCTVCGSEHGTMLDGLWEWLGEHRVCGG